MDVLTHARVKGVSVMKNLAFLILVLSTLMSCTVKNEKLNLVSKTMPQSKVNKIFDQFPQTELDPYFNNGRVAIETCNSLNMDSCDFALLYWSNGCSKTVDVIETCKAQLCSYEYKMNNETTNICE